jgi:uncharacterized membrane protein
MVISRESVSTSTHHSEQLNFTEFYLITEAVFCVYISSPTPVDFIAHSRKRATWSVQYQI